MNKLWEKVGFLERDIQHASDSVVFIIYVCIDLELDISSVKYPGNIIMLVGL